MRNALIIVDMLNDFVQPEASLYVPGVEDAIEPIQNLLAEARMNRDLIIFVCDAHDPDDLEFQRYPPHAIEDTPGAEIIKELAPRPGEHTASRPGPPIISIQPVLTNKGAHHGQNLIKTRR